MVHQNKIFSFKIKRQAKNVFPRDVKRTVDPWLSKVGPANSDQNVPVPSTLTLPVPSKDSDQTVQLHNICLIRVFAGHIVFVGHIPVPNND